MKWCGKCGKKVTDGNCCCINELKETAIIKPKEAKHIRNKMITNENKKIDTKTE